MHKSLYHLMGINMGIFSMQLLDEPRVSCEVFQSMVVDFLSSQ